MAVLETKRAFALLLTSTSVRSTFGRVVMKTPFLGHLYCNRFLTSTRGNCTTDMQCDPQMSVDLNLVVHPCNKDPMAINGNFNVADHPGLPLKRFHDSEIFQVFSFVLVPGIRPAGGVLVLL
jgi:hypothetical protein